ncbi:MAG: hypothetical protein M1837_003125 [Sclerophora amabilis]|nr:MAG: hypothetical protein M1837_003125 [Sclerophora amabilis]
MQEAIRSVDDRVTNANRDVHLFYIYTSKAEWIEFPLRGLGCQFTALRSKRDGMIIIKSKIDVRPGAGSDWMNRTDWFVVGGMHHSRVKHHVQIRNPSDLSTLLLLSSSSGIPLITLWTASWCPSCRVVSPLLRQLVDAPGAGGEDRLDGSGGGDVDGGGARESGLPVSYVEVELDAPEIGDLGMRYMITSIPTLLAFSRGEAQMETRVTAVTDLKDRGFIQRWIDREAKRKGMGGAGGGGGGLFGGLFGGGGR